MEKSENDKKGFVFIIDDDRASLDIVEQSLVKYGLNVKGFNNPIQGYEAITRSSQSDCECIVLDLLMPELDGFSFIMKLKKEHPEIEIPIIISSGNESIEYIKKGLELGAYDYFTKPLTKDDLEVTLPQKVKNAIIHHRTNKLLIEKNKKITEDLKLAKRFMLQLLPDLAQGKQDESKSFDKEHLQKSKSQFLYEYRPFNEIGGDLVDIVENNNSLVLFVVDISGHGISAAMIATFIKAEFQRYFFEKSDIKAFIHELNSTLYKLFFESFFCTVFLARYDKISKTLYYINCAHPPATVLSNSGMYILKPTGTLLGMFEDFTCKIKNIKVENQSILSVFTDGNYEFSVDSNNQIFGLYRLQSLAKVIYNYYFKNNQIDLKKFHNLVLMSLDKYSNYNYEDDFLLFNMILD